MKQQSPMLRLWELGEGQQGGLKRAVLSAVVGVLFGMLPYFAVAQIILGLLSGNQESSFYLTWCAVALVGFLLRATLYSLALSQSHKATFAILKSIREKVLEKLPKMPLGTILDTSSGQMKQVIVDQVESMERPLAHLLPEMTANVLGPVCILIYLFVLDWRMALLSLVSIPVGMAFMMAVMAGYHADKEVLHDVSLTIPAGTMTAFVGPSGSGKSTIAKLIAGFWDVTSGAITLGGQDLNRVPLKQLYDQVAFVSQDNYLFDESIRENIRMGRPAATDAEVEAVAKAAGCDAFIRSLEHGYDTVVGGGGVHLSGGERQRIAIARAMLKDAPIVVLDEATAYIDPENEAVVQQAVGKLVAGKTVLVIAHRLSTITGADQIVVVNGGRSQDVGTHGELLKNCPLYQEMWRAHMGAKEGEQA